MKTNNASMVKMRLRRSFTLIELLAVIAIIAILAASWGHNEAPLSFRIGDGRNCSWSKNCIGMPSVIKVGNRLAMLYDAPYGDSIIHMNRDIGLAWLDLPLAIPVATAK